MSSCKSVDFDSAYSKGLNELEQIIAKKRRLLLKINKKWTSGQQEKITIFATPVSGKFCSSNFHIIGKQRSGYEGKVCVPAASYVYSEEFWKSPEAKAILKYDFSKVKFDIIPY